MIVPLIWIKQYDDSTFRTNCPKLFPITWLRWYTPRRCISFITVRSICPWCIAQPLYGGLALHDNPGCSILLRLYGYIGVPALLAVNVLPYIPYGSGGTYPPVLR